MEVTTTKNLRPAVDPAGSRASFLDVEPDVFRKWLESTRDEQRRRVDIPIKDEIESTQNDVGKSEPEQQPSLFGHCAPLRVVRKQPSTVGDSESLIDRQERLIRLMERQQAWYDARVVAANEAAHLLQIIDHHQSQWLTHPSSSSPDSP
jgi:hypothetical protein